MTYSRPGGSSVNVSSGTNTSNVPKIAINGKSSLSPNGAQRNNVRPDLIYQNGMKKVEQIDKFVKFFSDDVIPFAGKELDRRAQNEVGEFLQNVPPEDVTAAGDQRNIDAMNSLSPRAKDKLISVQGRQAAAMYPAALQAAYAGNSKVLTPGNSPEATEIRAIAKAEAKAQAMEVVGLNKLPAYQTAVNAEALATAEGQVNGQLFQKQIAQEALIRQQTLVTAGATGLSKSFKNIQTGAARFEEGKQIETSALRGYLESVVKDLGETEGTVQQARLFAGVITRAQEDLSPTEFAKLLSDLKVQSNTPLYGVGGIDLWNFPMNDKGDTLGESLDELEDVAIQLADQENYEEKAGEMNRAILAGDMEGAYAILGSSADLITDPKYWNSLNQLFTAGQRRVTPEMITNQNNIEEQILKGETTAKDAVLDIFKGPPGLYSRQYLSNLTARAQQEVRTGQASVSPDKPAFTAYTGVINAKDSELDEKQFEARIALNIGGMPKGWEKENPGTTWDIYTRSEKIRVYSDRRDAFIELYNKAIAENGKAGDPLKILSEASSIAISKFNERAARNNTQGAETPAQELTSRSQTAQKQLIDATIANGGKLSIPLGALSENTQRRLQEKKKDWNSLSEKEKKNALADSFINLPERQKDGTTKPIDSRRAYDLVTKMLQQAKKAAANSPGAGIPKTVPVTEQEIQKTRSGAEISGLESLPGYQEDVNRTLNILQSVGDFLTQDKIGFGKEDITLEEAIRKWFNNDGMGDQSMRYVDGFLNMIAGVQPATAAPLTYGTPDGLASFRQAWKNGSQGLKTGPLPQVAASAQARPVPTAVGNDQHELFVMIGVSEGTRTAGGGYTKAYYGHSDPGDGNYNRGTVSGGRGSSASPEMVDQKWMGILTNLQQRMRPQLIVLGLMPGTQGYNRVMFNLMDLEVQSPAANQAFAGKLFGSVREAGFTIEAIAKARADSYINPATGRLEAGGFGNNYQTLIKDQRSRAGVYDYRRRL